MLKNQFSFYLELGEIEVPLLFSNINLCFYFTTKMTEKERDVVVPLMMRGFKDCALEAGCSVTGGQTVMNPWCTVGGVATTVCQPNEFIM